MSTVKVAVMNPGGMNGVPAPDFLQKFVRELQTGVESRLGAFSGESQTDDYPEELARRPQEEPAPLAPWWVYFLPDEAGMSDAYLDRHGEDWKYAAGFEHWYSWQETHWQPDETRRLRCHLGKMLDQVHAEALDIAQKAMAKAKEKMEAASSMDEGAEAKEAVGKAKAEMAKAMQWRKTDKRLNAVDNLLRDRKAIHPDRLGAGNLLNLSNGTLDLNNFLLYPHARRDLLTHCQSYAFDPAATCPRWKQFLDEVLVKEDGRTPDTELVSLFQEAVGYSLTTETRYEAMFWLSGAGANGKSTALGVVHALLGSLAKSIDLGALARPDASYYLAQLAGARVVFSTEASKGQAAADDILKRLASGEPIPARPIRGEPITIKPVAKLFWALNDKPTVRDTSDGFWRRLRLLPFHRQFSETERDTHLSEKLRPELSGILNWALVGLQRLRASGRFTEAAAVREAVAEYRTSQNALQLWLNERVTLHVDSRTGARAAFNDYLTWAAETNRQRTMTETAFGSELSRLVAKTKGRMGTQYHLGLLVVDGDLAHYADR